MPKRDKDTKNKQIFILTILIAILLGVFFIGIKSFTRNPYTIKECIRSNKENNFYPLIEVE
ncbi:MAG: hypothetical protein AB1765_04765 [Candidatus Hydrogenedentota bacterium]